MTHPTPRLAIVTGASRGLGRAFARRLAAEGIAVAAVSRTLRSGDGALEGSLEETVDLIRADGGRARAYAVDLGDPDLDRAELVTRIEADFGLTVDALVNNAAAARRYDVLFSDMRREWFQDSIETNVWNAWDLAAAVIPGMRRRGAGWIVNISSRQAGPRVGPPFAPHPLAGSVLYGGTKAMIDRMSTGAAMELYEDNIAVNSLAPNRGVATAHAAQAVPGWPSEPEETMAEAALALVTGDPKVLTGRIAYSLPLLKELDRPVHTVDGRELVPGWQPADMDASTFLGHYLTFAPPGAIPKALLEGASR
ncbi:SDR family NAD(P)-dependent oxidoreductase [Microbacterium sp. CFH 31415]|uniref:SDR family NAD(P)-dependent oxidoreductase n=1 Tax=Microbacterium sp. CFH 31415 TaxID=2921732 RepID=UPI001F143AE7|nr:SDR family NAD(P)-dependent oxidoreductase [Microbacterium sp. CFH 31415]MCH6231635.1 SDR family NAD(P)-dependent oxidoreductase [Microbacterium sp. CFH 31415]